MIIVFTSDHECSLGEHGKWAKYSNFNVTTYELLMFYVPGRITSFPEANEYHFAYLNLFHSALQFMALRRLVTDYVELMSQFLPSFHMELCRGENFLKHFWSLNLEEDLGFCGNFRESIAYSQYPWPEHSPQWNSEKPSWVKFWQTKLKRHKDDGLLHMQHRL